MSVNDGPADEVRTARLRLRRPTLCDTEAVLGLHSDPPAIPHNPADALTDLGQAQARIEAWMQHWDQHGIGYCLVSWLDDAEVLGVYGVKVLTLDGARVFNLLYRLNPSWWGQGVATEAASAVIERARHHQLGLRVVARVRPDNHASAGVAVAAGLRRAPHLDTRGKDGPEEVYSSQPVEPVLAARRER